MLKGIDPLLGPDILHLLAAMGHGDEVVIADANFPAASVARRLVRLDGIDTTRALAAILTLVPMDQYVDQPVAVMAVVNDPNATPDTYGDFIRVIAAAEGKIPDLERVERFAFYERARRAFGVVATSDTRLYANIILKKGVVAPSQKA
jgi:L-fucose mutarotase